jgi:hypothetical protein
MLEILVDIAYVAVKIINIVYCQSRGYLFFLKAEMGYMLHNKGSLHSNIREKTK